MSKLMTQYQAQAAYDKIQATHARGATRCAIDVNVQMGVVDFASFVPDGKTVHMILIQLVHICAPYEPTTAECVEKYWSHAEFKRAYGVK